MLLEIAVGDVFEDACGLKWVVCYDSISYPDHYGKSGKWSNSGWFIVYEKANFLSLGDVAPANGVKEMKKLPEKNMAVALYAGRSCHSTHKISSDAPTEN